MATPRMSLNEVLRSVHAPASIREKPGTVSQLRILQQATPPSSAASSVRSNVSPPTLTAAQLSNNQLQHRQIPPRTNFQRWHHLGVTESPPVSSEEYPMAAAPHGSNPQPQHNHNNSKKKKLSFWIQKLNQLNMLAGAQDGDLHHEMDDIRDKIISCLSKMEEQRERVSSQQKQYHDLEAEVRRRNAGPEVSIEGIGLTEKDKKPFGKRVFAGGIPIPLPPSPRGAYSKRMKIEFSDRARRQHTLQRSGELSAGVGSEGIFSPKNAMLRAGLTSVRESPLNQTSSSFFPTLQRQQQSNLDRPKVVRTAEDGLRQRPTSYATEFVPREVTVRGFEPSQPVYPSKIRETRRYDNFIQEKGARPLPTAEERLKRYYGNI